MREGTMKILNPSFVLLDHCLKNSKKLLRISHFLQIDPIFLLPQFLFLYFHRILIKGSKLFLSDFPILLILQPLVRGESVG